MTPDPQQFARTVLWQLTAIRADLASVKAQLDLVQDLAGHPPSPSLMQNAQDQELRTQLELFQEACRQVGLDATPPAGADSNGAIPDNP